MLIYEYPDPLITIPSETIHVSGETEYLLELPTYENVNLRLASWICNGVSYEPGTAITVRGTSYFYAEWETRTYTITYANLLYGTQRANVRNEIYEYEYGEFPSLSGVTANFTVDPYSPQFRFLGWYSDMSFIRPYNTVGYLYGDVTVYAKWRCDYTNLARTNVYTITDDGIDKQLYDIIAIALGVDNSYANLTAMGINTLSLKIYLNMWEKDDGYQEVYVYTDTGVTLWSNNAIEHGGSSKVTTASVYKITVDIPMSTISGANVVYIKYSAHGKDDDWCNQVYYEVMYYRDATDKTAMGFYWRMTIRLRRIRTKLKALRQNRASGECRSL